MTVSAAIEEYLVYTQRRGFTTQTRETYERHLRTFAAFLADYYPRVTTIEEVDREIVVDYQDYLSQRSARNGRPLSNKTIALKLTVLRSFFSFLVKESLTLSEPTKAMVLPKQERRLVPNVLSEQEIAQVLESCDLRTPLGMRNRAVLELFYATGMRTTELCSLRTGHVDLAAQTVLVENGKGGKSRLLPIGQYAAYYVGEYVSKARKYLLRNSRHDPGILFVTQFGRPFDRKSINKSVMRPIQRRLGLKKDLTCYTFRRSLATQLIQHNVDVSYVARLLGHESLNTTQRYLRIEIGDLKRMHSLYHPREAAHSRVEQA